MIKRTCQVVCLLAFKLQANGIRKIPIAKCLFSSANLTWCSLNVLPQNYLWKYLILKQTCSVQNFSLSSLELFLHFVFGSTENQPLHLLLFIVSLDHQNENWTKWSNQGSALLNALQVIFSIYYASGKNCCMKHHT